MLVEQADILNASTTPAINGLVVVAYCHQIISVAYQVAQPRILNSVGILKLIDQNIGKTITIVITKAGVVQPQLIGAHQQLGKVDHTEFFALCFISEIDVVHSLFEWVKAGFVVIGAQPFIFFSVDKPLSLTWRPLGIIQIHRLHNALDDA